jgi:hypothetical protein
VLIGTDVPEEEIKRQIRNSYDLIKPKGEETEMTNIKTGQIGAAVTGVSTAAFAFAMITGLATGADTSAVSYFVCIFIAVGYVMFSASVVAPTKERQLTATGLVGLAFAVVYVLLIIIVYYSMLTTVRMNGGSLSEETLSIISYNHLGSLFFNYDLLGYGFMGLSTFFIGFSIMPRTKGDRALRVLLRIHGVFFVSCLIMPMFPIFTAEMEGGEIIGTLALVAWSAYYLPVCILGWRYFRKEQSD